MPRPTSKPSIYDVLIVGAGIIGAAVARELSRYRLKCLLVEKEVNPGFGVTKGSYSLLHSGHTYPTGSLKARLCVESGPSFDRVTRELEVPFRRVGELVVAMNEGEVPELKRLKAQGEANGVQGLEIIGRERLREMEPHIIREAVAALHSPGDGILHAPELTMALVENAEANGTELMLETEVEAISSDGSSAFLIKTSRGSLRARFLVNAAGLYADEVAAMVGEDDLSITARKPQVAILDKEVGGLVSRVIDRVTRPTVPMVIRRVAPTIHGNLMIIGGTYRDPRDKGDRAVPPEGVRELAEIGRELVPALSGKEIITTFTGLVTVNSRDPTDSVIEVSHKARRFINAVISPPGMSICFAVARHVVELLSGEGLELSPREDFNPYRRGIPRFRELPWAEQESLIERDPRFAHMVCRCEGVTEAEVVEAIGRGARTLDGVKHRTRAGMGRCQGGFCSPRVMRILSRELGIPMVDLTKKGANSQHLLFRSKELLDGHR